MSDHDERRRFVRIPFNAHTELRQGGQRWPVELIDLSLKGMLVKRPRAWEPDPAQNFEAVVHLDEEVKVEMLVGLRHEESARLGFACLYIDVDSMTHLHRLVELNLADGTEMMRELRELIKI